MIFSVLFMLLIVAAVVCFLGLTPERVTEDILRILSPKRTLRDRVKEAQRVKKADSLLSKLNRIRTALESTGKSKQFSLVCSASFWLFLAGCLISVLIGNLFLFPVLSVAMALVPFIYVRNTLSYYDRHVKDELETALSVISTSYNRSEDIAAAVNENIPHIKPPLREVFRGFSGEVIAVSSDVKGTLYHLKSKINDAVFHEWCDMLIQCQDDRTLRETLFPVVAKLTDMRVVNNELKTMISAAKSEYRAMAMLVVLNIPLLYMLNRDWFEVLLTTVPGKLVLSVCGAVVLVTALFMMKWTKPVEYKR